jgi:hypothetical protein
MLVDLSYLPNKGIVRQLILLIKMGLISTEERSRDEAATIEATAGY